ncbi:hypothetical protein CHS0354_036769 [Potamilus streckersoni]|uniref:Uncharacterized protein n=1 Tax=Potamilus streckersoni TaxID=2493646 RepID=A0AAE0S5G7_9BIVA|nr:hypothetical protein CHS0354_036769 [Potamilus streckersoni]
MHQDETTHSTIHNGPNQIVLMIHVGGIVSIRAKDFMCRAPPFSGYLRDLRCQSSTLLLSVKKSQRLRGQALRLSLADKSPALGLTVSWGSSVTTPGTTLSPGRVPPQMGYCLAMGMECRPNRASIPTRDYNQSRRTQFK